MMTRKPADIENTNVILLKEPDALYFSCFEYSCYSLFFHEYGTISFLYQFNSATNLAFSSRV
jgi:hypothetical protein